MNSTALSKLTAFESETINDRYPAWSHVVPFPPDGLMWSAGAGSLENFLVVGDAWAQIVSHFAPESAHVLDIGCGCGRSSRMLINNRWIRKYTAFDVLRESINWCVRYVKPAWKGTAEFYWFDVYSAEYNPRGSLAACDLKFPVDDNSVDVAFAASLFTHLLEEDARHYLCEIARVLKSTGLAIISIHVSPLFGREFSGTEARIDINPQYFQDLAHSAGLRRIEDIGDVGGQQTFVFVRASQLNTD